MALAIEKSGHCHLELLTKENVCYVLLNCARTRVIFVAIALKFSCYRCRFDHRFKETLNFFTPCKLYLTTASALLHFSNV